jgi:hypothetical protein
MCATRRQTRIDPDRCILHAITRLTVRIVTAKAGKLDFIPNAAATNLVGLEGD